MFLVRMCTTMMTITNEPLVKGMYFAKTVILLNVPWLSVFVLLLVFRGKTDTPEFWFLTIKIEFEVCYSSAQIQILPDSAKPKQQQQSAPLSDFKEEEKKKKKSKQNKAKQYKFWWKRSFGIHNLRLWFYSINSKSDIHLFIYKYILPFIQSIFCFHHSIQLTTTTIIFNA